MLNGQRNVNLLRRIDTVRLAGIRRLVGVDLTEGGARIVELERRGSVFNRFKSAFEAVASLSVEFTSERTILEKAANVRGRLRAEGITSRYAISSVRSLGVKVISATVPSSADDMDEWIREHYEKLLKLPLSLRDVSFRHDILETNESGTVVEVTFVRNSDLEEYRTFFRSAGLELIALGAGTRDVFNTLYVAEPTILEEDATVVYVAENTMSVTPMKKGRRAASKQFAIGREDNLDNILSDSLRPGRGSDDKLIVAGEAHSRLSSHAGRAMKPFRLSAEFALAAGLAIKGFLPEISPVEFLEEQEKSRFAAAVYRSLTQRTVLALGSVIILLLITQMVASIYIRSAIDQLDEQLVSSGTAYSQIALLEQQVKSLEGKLQGGEGLPGGTNFARVLHDLAAATTESLWLYKFSVNAMERRQARLSLGGYAKANEDVAGFLKKLQFSGLCSEVKLVRLGSPGQLPSASEPVLPLQARRASLVTFEINATVKE